MCKKTVFDLQREGAPKDLVVILESKWSLQYEASRAISNSKFDYKPSGIAYCKNISHVQFCTNYCRNNDIEFRIRSGGHQHEGMSSGNNILIIDLSEIHEITFITNKEEAWIPSGKKLENVYQELEEKEYIIPGGGCQSVNVGGLTQGGGWGASIRKLGFTCDNILEAEMVLANGQIVYPSPTNFPDLFWGLKGGGGGNFGIVTRFRFKLTKLEGAMTSFSLKWEDPNDAKNAILHWMKMQRELDHYRNLSTACRMSIEAPNTILSRMGGQFYGTEKKLKNILKKYFGKLFDKGIFEPKTKCFPPKKRTCNVEEDNLGTSKSEPTAELSLSDAQKYVAELLNPTNPFGELGLIIENLSSSKENSCKPLGKNLPKAPSVTCDNPHPHKVTSTFPRSVSKKESINLDQEIVNRIHDYLSNSCYYEDVARYMSFHCMGGAVRDNPTGRAFPYADAPYMLQAQTWWNLSNDKSVDDDRKKAYNKWIECFRSSLGDAIHGSFINFVDKDICGPYEPSKRQAILTQYYTEKNLKKLIKIKQKYDPFNLFNFRLSIPLEYKKG